MAAPVRETIARSGHRTRPEGSAPSGPIEWGEIDRQLRAGDAACWLSAPNGGGVHTRPVFAAWTGSSFVVASNPAAVKTRHLEAADRCSVATGLQGIHLVVEATPRRLTEPDDLRRAVAAFADVYDWPTEVAGDLLDAPYAAPTSGGPPFRVYELIPLRAHAFPTDDGFEPTRFRFGRPDAGA
jgi:hypothetical protein